MRIKYIIAALALVNILACGLTPKAAGTIKSEQLRLLVSESRNDIDFDNLRAIMVVTERGCLSCNRAFADMLTEHLNDTTMLFWVSAMGQGVDISPFQLASGRVIWDYEDRLRPLGLAEGSGAILIQHGAIDTIIPLDAKNIAESLDFLAGQFHALTTDSLKNSLP